MISYKVLITIVLIFFKSYYAVVLLDFNLYQKCFSDLNIIGFDDTDTFRNVILLRSFAMKRDPPIKICDDSVNKDGCDETLHTDTASLPDIHQPLLNQVSQNLNEEKTNKINMDGCNGKNEKTAPLPGDRQLFLNHALQKLNEDIKKRNDKINEDECDETLYTDIASLPVYINEYYDVLIKIKCFAIFKTPLQYCEHLNNLRENEKDIFNNIANLFKGSFNVQECKNGIIEKYYDEFNAYKNFLTTMDIMDPNIKEYTKEDLNVIALQYFSHEESIIKSQRNNSNDYYINGPGKWCARKFKAQENPQIKASGTSGTSGTNGTNDTEIN